MRQRQASFTDLAGRRSYRFADEQASSVAVQVPHEAIDVSEPPRFDSVAMVRDAMDAGEQQRVGKRKRRRAWSERRNRNPARPDGIELENCIERERIGRAPVKVDDVRRGRRGRVMSLAGGQPGIGLELSTIPERREHTVRRVELAMRNQQIRVAAFAFFGIFVDEQGERRALDDEHVDAAVRERIQQRGERFLAEQVSRDPAVARCGLHSSRASHQGPE